MGYVKKLSVAVHQGLLEGFILIIITITCVISVVEASMLTHYQSVVYNEPIVGLFATMCGTLFWQNWVLTFAASLTMMVLPIVIQHSKSEFSASGAKVSILEFVVISFFLVVACVVPYLVYDSLTNALNECRKLGKITEAEKTLRTAANVKIIICHVLFDVMIGFYSIYEDSYEKLSFVVIGKKKQEKPAEKPKEAKYVQADVSSVWSTVTSMIELTYDRLSITPPKDLNKSLHTKQLAKRVMLGLGYTFKEGQWFVEKDKENALVERVRELLSVNKNPVEVTNYLKKIL
jgi:hypothetical protein